MPDSAHFSLLAELFETARALDADERAAYLARRCNGDAALLARVRGLLRHHESTHGPFVEPLALDTSGLLAAAAPPAVPASIGGYTVVRLIGAGGMGAVYLAEQPAPRRHVALKVIRPGIVSPDALRRLRHEASLLGRLRHPGIAQIYEAGTYHDGVGPRPYFAMEYVDGVPLRRHADAQGLDVRERLELIARVCDAVQHAHQHGVIHRDLKPANVLVDEVGQPKVLDFGVARSTDESPPSLATRTGALLGTVGYMSPEQVEGGPDAVDTRTDVHALGVMLYELLAGRMPYDLSGTSMIGVLQRVREAAPARLGSVVPSLRGDVETICAKALEKDKERRYPSAGELADDLRRFLRGAPIGARRDSALYMLRKTLSRYRWPVAALALFVVLLGAFAGYALVQARSYRALAQRESQAMQRAQTSAARAAAVKDFLQDMLAAADPRRAGGRNVTVREVLDDASERIAAGLLSEEPEVEAEVRTTIAHTCFNLGLNTAAIPHYEWICDHRETKLGSAAAETIEALCWLGRAHIEAPNPEPARPIFERALGLALDGLGPDHEMTLRAMNGLGAALTRLRREDEAEALHREVLEGLQRLYRDEHALFVSTSLHLGQVYARQRRFADAERIYEKALDAAEPFHGVDARVTIRLRWQLASEIYAQTERLAQAEAVLTEALADARAALGPEHPETLIVLTRLSRVLEQAGRADEAETLLRAAIADLTEARALGGDDAIKAVGALVQLLSHQARQDEAVALLRDGLESVQGASDPHPLVLAEWLSHLSWMEFDRGEFTTAADVERRVLEIRQEHLGPTHASVGTSWWRLGNYLHACVSYDTGPVQECIAARRQALALFAEGKGEVHSTTIDASITLAWGLMVQRDYRATEHVLRERLEHVRAELGEMHFQTQRVSSYLSSLAQYAGRPAEAAVLCRKWIQRLREAQPSDHFGLGTWALRLGMSCYLDADPGAAIEALRASAAEFEAAERPESAAVVRWWLADALIAAGRADEALPVAEDAVAMLRASRFEQHLFRWEAERAWAHARVACGDLAGGESALRTCIEAFLALPLSLTEEQIQVGRALRARGDCLARMGRYEDAEDALLEAHTLLSAACGERHGLALRARDGLAALYARWGRAQDAEIWRQPAAGPDSSPGARPEISGGAQAGG